jgi:hypothetical protein
MLKPNTALYSLVLALGVYRNYLAPGDHAFTVKNDLGEAHDQSSD